MGDIADGLINGDFDCFTGEYLGEGHGYPRSHSQPIYRSKKWHKQNPKGGSYLVGRKIDASIGDKTINCKVLSYHKGKKGSHYKLEDDEGKLYTVRFNKLLNI